MLHCNPPHTPAQEVHKLDDIDPLVKDPTLICSLAGALQYLTFTKPNIAFVFQETCVYMHYPREQHINALKCILIHIYGIINHNLQI